MINGQSIQDLNKMKEEFECSKKKSAPNPDGNHRTENNDSSIDFEQTIPFSSDLSDSQLELMNSFINSSQQRHRYLFNTCPPKLYYWPWR